MYTPQFNTVLVKINDEDAKWGTGNDDSMLGKSFREGEVIDYGKLLSTAAYPLPIGTDTNIAKDLQAIIGQQIMWNEGVEAGTVFEHDGSQYAFIYWFDIRGVKQ